MHINWHLETKSVNELTPDKTNPRIMTKRGLKVLKESIDRFGLAEPLIINTDGMLIGGHARLQILLAENVKEVECYVPDRTLSEEEYKELNIRLNKNIAGEWDFSILNTEFKIDELLEWGFSGNELYQLAEETNRIAEWDGMPEFSQDQVAHRRIAVSFTNEEDVQAFAKLVEQTITDKTRYIWYPFLPRLDMAGVEYKENEE